MNVTSSHKSDLPKMGSQTGQVRIARDKRGVATLTLDHPKRCNALTKDMIDTLTQFARAAHDDAGLRVIVLRGAGADFCAGGDLHWLQAQVFGDAAYRREEALRMARMFSALDALEVPLIGAVSGVAVGGGAGLAAICDETFATPDARLGLSETKIGIVPGILVPFLKPRLEPRRALAMQMNSRLLDADDAFATGIVTRIVSQDALEDALEADIANYLSLPKGAVARAKANARPRLANFEEELEAAITALSNALGSDEAREGITAFLEKRHPTWVGKEERP